MTLKQLQSDVVACRLCPRLVAYREEVARTRKKAFQSEEYWGKAVPGFGDPRASMIIVGLAPAAHGANRTGRMFTGDGTDGRGASDFLMSALHRAGYANQPTSLHRGDGLILKDAWMTAIVRCAPPDNKPLPEEIRNCAAHLSREIALLKQARVIVSLGKLSFDQVLCLFEKQGASLPRPRPRFGHGTIHETGAEFPVLLGSYHPSRQNTQTGLLTPEMLDGILKTARELCERRTLHE